MKLPYLIIAILITSLVFAQTTTTLVTKKDASIGFHDGYSSADTNYGNATHYSAFSQPSASGDGENAGQGIMDFDFTVIPEGATIVSATLSLYAFGDGFSIPLPDGHDGENASYLSRIISSWSENTVTWNTRPDITDENRVMLPESTSPLEDYLDIDVTALVQDIIDNPTTSFGLCLSLVDESPTRGMLFASSDYGDASKAQKLSIAYTLPDATFEIKNSDYEILVYPNPVKNEFTLQLNLENSGNVNYNLTDINGNIILENKLGEIKNGQTNISISLDQPNIPEAYYFLQVTIDDKIQIIKILKTK